MAKIIQTQEQTEALTSVRNDLKQLKMINDFIEQVNRDASKDIIFCASTQGFSIKINLDRKSVLDLLDKQKRKLQKEISANASQFCIMLDEADKEILEK